MKKMTKPVMVRGVQIGGGAPVVIQSMTNTDTRNVEATLEQIEALHRAGCRIVRLAIPDMEAAEAFGEIRKRTDVPLVCDIHFDWRLALASIEAGADKIRINPGNIGSEERVRAVVDAAKAHHIPIRIGVNSGSLEKDILARDGRVTAGGMAESVMRMVRLVEDMDFDDIVISVKASDVVMNYETYLKVSQMTDHPLHVGVTESGTPELGTVKSAAGIGALLLAGVGDTIRVSLSGDPLAEVPVARQILQCTGNMKGGIDFVSCPTCSRCRTDVAGITTELSHRLRDYSERLMEADCEGLTVAVMGCAVNGPGEARSADMGAACGDGNGVIFSGGSVIRTVASEQIADELFTMASEEAERRLKDAGRH